MSIASDIRSYADNAVTEGRKILDSTLSTAQTQLNDVSGSANDIVDKATEAVNELLANAEKAINLDAIKAAIEPYVAQAKSYQANVTDRAEAIIAELRKDPRLAKAFDVADSVSGVVVDTARERVVKPVQSLTGLGATETKPAATRKPSPTKAATRKPATTKPATAKPATKPATKAAAKKTSTTTASTTARPAAKKAAARKAPAKKATKA